MKFGQNFWARQVPEWTDAYIDYDGLKEKAKSPGGELQLLSGLLREVENFSMQQHARIRKRIDAIVEHFNLHRASPWTKNLEELSQSELQSLAAAVKDIKSSLADLNLFSMTNHEAICRLATKISGGFEASRWSDWTGDLLFLNSVLQSVTQAQVKIPSSQGPMVMPLEPGLGFKLDFRGRNILHYAAESCSPETVAEIVATARRDGQLYKALSDFDDAGRTPIQIAIRRGDAEVARLLFGLLASEEGGQHEDRSTSSEWEGGFLALAIRLAHGDIAKELTQFPNQLRYRGKHGETALHLAARMGQIEVVQVLLAAKIGVNDEETARGRTPLIIACAGGHSEIAHMLIQRGAQTDKLDRRGWSAIDHAAYRGYPKIIVALQMASKSSSTAAAPSSKLQTPTKAQLSIPYIPAGGRALTSRYDQGKCHVYGNLGTFNLFKTVQPIDLEPLALSSPFVTESHLWLEVSASECDAPEEPYLYRLPILEDLTNNPWHFTTSNPDKITLIFKIRAVTGEEQQNHRLATGMAMLAALREGLGPAKESLVRDHKIPLLGRDGSYAGSITFNFIVSRPFLGASSPPTPSQSMRQTSVTQIGGHRGLGQNNKKREHLQIGENTMESFKSAMDLGASFIEFDVQVTKDLIPVIYHDFLVSEAGTDATMHNLSYAQFMAISDAQSGKQEAPGPERLPWDERARPTAPQSKRSRSLCSPADTATASILDRMRHTFEGANPGFVKPNTRGKHIHGPFTTLQEMFEKLPESVSFDMEIKYPMLYEADDFKMDTMAMELNLFLDTILEVVYKHAGNRHLFFTSFSPEVCIMLATKQSTYPILFLNDSSNWPTGDSRALSTQTAVHFARKWGLRGVVMASEPFVAAPKLIRFVKDKGLYTSTYGAQNDDPEMAMIQANAGLDSIIVNNVHLISKAFEKNFG